MAHSPEAVLCILQVDALTVFSTAGKCSKTNLAVQSQIYNTQASSGKQSRGYYVKESKD